MVFCLGGTDASTQWYAVQSKQLVIFTKHLITIHCNAGVRYNVFTIPGEVILSIIIMMVVRGTLGLDWFVTLYESTFRRAVAALDGKGVEISEDHV